MSDGYEAGASCFDVSIAFLFLKQCSPSMEASCCLLVGLLFLLSTSMNMASAAKEAKCSLHSPYNGINHTTGFKCSRVAPDDAVSLEVFPLPEKLSFRHKKITLYSVIIMTLEGHMDEKEWKRIASGTKKLFKMWLKCTH